MKFSKFIKGTVNVATDASSHQGVGTAILASSLGREGAIALWVLVGLSALTRIGTEYLHASEQEAPKTKIGQGVASYLKNRGASLMVRGAGFLGFSLWSLWKNGVDDPFSRSRTAIMALFSGALHFRGRSLGFEAGSKERNLLEGVGMTMNCIGCGVMAAGEGGGTVGTIAVAGVVSLTQLFNKSVAETVGKYCVPDLMLGATFASIALTSQDPVLRTTNAFYAFSYLFSLPLTKTFGSVADALVRPFQKRDPVEGTDLPVAAQNSSLRVEQGNPESKLQSPQR